MSEYRESDEYKEIIEILKKDKKIIKYFKDMKDTNFPSHEEYQKTYNEFIQYQDKMIKLLGRSLKIKKILDVKNSSNKTI